MFDPENYCEGCAAVVDQAHLPDCSVYREQLRRTDT